MISYFKNFLENIPETFHQKPEWTVSDIEKILINLKGVPVDLTFWPDWLKLRNKTFKKFGSSDILLDQFAYEQSSSIQVAKYKAGLLPQGEILDLCCGIGADSIMVAGDTKVVGVDLSPQRLDCFNYNHQKFRGHSSYESIQEDVNKINITSKATLIDPDRRPVDKNKSWGMDQLSPSLSDLTQIVNKNTNCLIKLSPAADISQFIIKSEFSTCFLGSQNSSKELLIKTGSFIVEGIETVLLGEGLTRVHTKSESLQAQSSLAITQTLPRYIHEPINPSLSSGLYWLEASNFGFHQINPSIAYFFSDSAARSPFWNSFRIHDEVAFRDKKINSFLKSGSWGQIEVKKRGLNIDPIQLQLKWKKQLKNQDKSNILSVFLFPDPINNAKPRVIFAERVKRLE